MFIINTGKFAPIILKIESSSTDRLEALELASDCNTYISFVPELRILEDIFRKLMVNRR